MNGTLNTGKGQCLGIALLGLYPSKSAVEMDAAYDVVIAALRAVHHVNRHAKHDDFIAVSLPFINNRSSFRPGNPHPSNQLSVELLGTEAAFEALMTCDRITSLKRCGALSPSIISDPMIDIGASGVAFVRERARAKHLSPSENRRTKKRADKQKAWLADGLNKAEAASIKYQPAKTEHDSGLLALRYDPAIITVKSLEGIVKPGPFEVTTYGYSSPVNPSFLPVTPLSEENNFAE